MKHLLGFIVDEVMCYRNVWLTFRTIWLYYQMTKPKNDTNRFRRCNEMVLDVVKQSEIFRTQY